LHQLEMRKRRARNAFRLHPRGDSIVEVSHRRPSYSAQSRWNNGRDCKARALRSALQVGTFEARRQLRKPERRQQVARPQSRDVQQFITTSRGREG
jgi:hypothetical protein